MFLFIFYAALSVPVKTLTVVGYYFVFEYALFSRNYFIAVLVAFLVCITLNSSHRHKYAGYYGLLFLLCTSHFFAVLLAGAFQCYLLMSLREREGIKRSFFIHVVLGACVFLAFLCFIFLTSTIAPGSANWLKSWDSGRLTLAAQLPLRAFMPIPAWWKYHFWNTNAIWDMAGTSRLLKLTAIFISAVVAALAIFVFIKNKKALVFFTVNFGLLLVLAVLFPVYNTRYVGFAYIGFLVALWLAGQEQRLDPLRKKIVYVLLVLQLPGAFIAVSRELALPFSQVNEVKNVIATVPKGNPLITDFWGLNYLSAVTDRPYYCVESRKEQSFILGSKDWAEILNDPHRYTYGVADFFEKSHSTFVYFLCNFPPGELNQYDTYFNSAFNVSLVSARIGAIERYSDLYLYKISERKK